MTIKAIVEHKLNIKKLALSSHEADRAWLLLAATDATNSKKANSTVEIIDSIRTGLPVNGITAILEKTSINRNQLSHILHISTRQMSRYTATERLNPEQSNFLYELARIYTKTLDVLGDKATAENWLNRKNMALGDNAPLELLDTAEGVRLVDDLLAQIEYGFYS